MFFYKYKNVSTLKQHIHFLMINIIYETLKAIKPLKPNLKIIDRNTMFHNTIIIDFINIFSF